jgi:hypothetical protein
MTDPEVTIIAECLSKWLKDDTPTAGIADDIVNALDDAGFIIVEVGKPLLAVTEEGLTLSIPEIAANDIVVPFDGWVDLEKGE